ncbi:hypothetical protein PAMA_021804 [Pampus argenteus]
MTATQWRTGQLETRLTWLCFKSARVHHLISIFSIVYRPLDPDEAPSEASAAQCPPDNPPTPEPECPPSKQAATKKMQNKNSPLDTLRQRHKGKAVLSKKKADKDKKTTDIYQQISADTCGSLWRQRSLAHWLHRCRWALLCMYVFVLVSVITLTYFLWKLHDDTLEP